VTGFSQRWIQRWYDTFAFGYDPAFAWMYRAPRNAMVAALDLRPGDSVLDIGTGTGQNLPLLAAAVGPQGLVIGLDHSPGMLARAQRTVDRLALPNVKLSRGDAGEIDAQWWSAAAQTDRPPSAVTAALTLSVMPPWREAFTRSFALLAGGGRYGILDMIPFTGPLSPVNLLVNAASASDIRRPVLQLLDPVSDVIHREDFPMSCTRVVVATKPAQTTETAEEAPP